jgi:hypothetical protein
MSTMFSGHESRTRSLTPIRSLLICAGLLGAGYLIGSVASQPTTASAQVINSAPDQHFMSGDQLSLPVIQDIAATLHQMDARLGRLELVAGQMASERAGASKKAQ